MTECQPGEDSGIELYGSEQTAEHFLISLVLVLFLIPIMIPSSAQEITEHLQVVSAAKAGILPHCLVHILGKAVHFYSASVSSTLRRREVVR